MAEARRVELEGPRQGHQPGGRLASIQEPQDHILSRAASSCLVFVLSLPALLDVLTAAP